MGMKDKQMPSRCWERCSSPRRMRVRLPATPALPALTPGARGGPRGRAGSDVPSCSSPIAGVHTGTPGRWCRISPEPSLAAPGSLPGAKLTSARGGSLVLGSRGAPGGAWGFGPPPLAIVWQRGQAAAGSGNSADTATAQWSPAPAAG